MTPEINKFFKILSSAKGIVLALVILILGIFIWNNLDFMSEVTFTIKNEATGDSKKEAKAYLDFGSIFIPPSPKHLPTIIVFEVKNPSDVVSRNARINIDLGTSKAIDYEVIGPNVNDVSKTTPGTSLINIDLKLIRPHESAFIYIQSTNSTFKRISISSDTSDYTKDFTLNDYLTRDNTSKPTALDMLLFVIGTTALLFFIFIMVGVARKINKKYDLGW